MSDAPKTIWAGKYHGTFWQSTPHHQMTEYTRTDTIPSPDALIRATLEDARTVIEKKRLEYQIECGRYDPSTGQTEYPGNGDELIEDLEGFEDAIRAIADDPKAIARIIKAAEGRG